MAKETKGPRPRIPRFRSREEEAQFWDTDDSTEFEWRPARIKVAEKIQHVFSVPLEIEVLTWLVETSRATGVGVGALAARLIAEGLERMDTVPRPARREKGKQNG